MSDRREFLGSFVRVGALAGAVPLAGRPSGPGTGGGYGNVTGSPAPPDAVRRRRAREVQARVDLCARRGESTCHLPPELAGYDPRRVDVPSPVRLAWEGTPPGVFDVTAYGAVGDGSTDAQPAFQACVDCAHDDSVVWIPGGRYRLDSSVVVEAVQNVLFTGPGRIEFGDVGAFVVRTVRAGPEHRTEDVRFDRLHLHGGGSDGTGILVSQEGATCRVEVVGCEIEECGCAIRTTGRAGASVIVRGCRLVASDLPGSVGIDLDSPDNELVNCKIGGFETGIRTTAGAVRCVDVHVFLTPSDSHRRGVDVQGADLTAIGCVFEGAYREGAMVVDARFGRHKVLGCRFQVDRGAGPFIRFEAPGGRDVRIRDVVVVGCSFFGRGGHKSDGFGMGEAVSRSETPGLVLESCIFQQADPFRTRARVLSEPFPVDSEGPRTLAIPHGLPVEPSPAACQLTAVAEEDPADWGYDQLQVIAVGPLEVLAQVNVTRPSSERGATARLALQAATSA